MSEAGPARSRALLHLATALAEPVGAHHVVETVLELLARASLSPVSLGLRAPDGVLRTYRAGLPDAVTSRLATLPGSALPGRRVALDGVPRFLDGVTFATENPQAAQVLAGSGFEAAAVLPLQVADGTVGYLGFHLPADHRFDADEQDFLVTVAALVSGSLDRARLAEQETAARADAEATAARFVHLQSLMARLASAASGSEISEVLAVDGARAMGAQMTTVMVTRGDGRALEMAAHVNQPERVVDRFAVVRLDADVPAAQAVRSGEPVLLGSRADREARYPLLVDVDMTYEATATVPLVAAGRALGTLTFGWTDPRAFSENDVRLFAAIAEQSAAALERGRLFDAERAALSAAEQAEHRLRLLADVGDAVSASLDPDVVAQRLVELLVPVLAPHCLLYVEDDNRLLRPRASAHDPSSHLARVLADLSPTHPSGVGPHTTVFRTRRPLLIDVLAESDVSGTPRSLHLVGSSVIAAPLVSRGEALGVIVALRPPGSPFTTQDLSQLDQIATRAALALDNARLFTARTRVAAQLQAGLLPSELPAVPGLTFAARYRAGDTEAEVGGDFYDVFRLGPDELALVIGDVSGRGVAAAGLTGLARATLRAFPPEFSPAQALNRLNELLLQRGNRHDFLTAAYVRLCRTADGVHVTTALAGHPHPLVVRHGTGQVEKVGRPGLILGVTDSPELHEQRSVLSPGDLLLMFTDGVTEAKDASEMFGDGRLATTLRRLRARSPESVVDGIEDAVLTFRDRGADDLALLAVRVDADGVPSDRVLLDHRLPAEVSAPTAGRRLVRQAVDELITGRALQDLELSVNELVTNAVRHLQNDPSRLPRTDPIRLRALLAPGRLRIEVSNPGPGFPVPNALPGVDAEGGRGLPLVSALSQQMGVETRDGVTLVWFDTEV